MRLSIFDKPYKNKDDLNGTSEIELERKPLFSISYLNFIFKAFKPSNIKYFFKKFYKIFRISLATILNIFACLMLTFTVTICVVAVALTVYVMSFADQAEDLSLSDAKVALSSYLYAKDENGEFYEKKQLSTDEHRVWVKIEDMPQCLIDAVVAVEDKRFFSHEGVDWYRSFAVVANAALGDEVQGGSTITQQLVRDITKDTEVDVGRKLREIFRALNLEDRYTKYEILENYLNRISFGGTSYGVGSASLNYFGIPLEEWEENGLGVAEAAILAGIIRSPSTFNPYASTKNCKKWQKNALAIMLEVGLISNDEYDDARYKKIRFRRPVSGDEFGVDPRYEEYLDELSGANLTDEDLYYVDVPWEEIKNDTPYTWHGDYEITQNWYDDAVINQVISEIAEMRGLTYSQARTEVLKGGYTIYSNEDPVLQARLDETMRDPYIALSKYNPNAESKDLLQAAFVLMDLQGTPLAVSGGLGDKPGDNCFSRATQSLRSIGSTTKPISVYAPAVDNNVITYSTMIPDRSGTIPSETVAGATEPWPFNYGESYPANSGLHPTWWAVQKSTNTIAARVLQRIGLQTSYNFLETLGFSTLDPSNDMAYSPLAFGAQTYGTSLIELTAAYQIFGNGGVYYKPYFFSKVTDNTGKVILEQPKTGVQAIGSDSAWVVNRMIKKVIEDTAGSGHYAKLPNVEVVGKTGTSNDMSNLTFAALTPDYVGVFRIGFDDNREISSNPSGDGWKPIARTWSDIMKSTLPENYFNDIHEFTPDSSVQVASYCTATGLIAGANCSSSNIGYYRPSNIPDTCRHDGTQVFDNGEVPKYG